MSLWLQRGLVLATNCKNELSLVAEVDSVNDIWSNEFDFDFKEIET